ncbi:MAG: POTRA domain-containing protein [Bacteroidota bacterium]
MLRYKKIFPLIFLSFFSSSFIFSQTDSSSFQTKPNDYVVINEINIFGNKVTKRHIILRELSFAVKDTIEKSNLHEKLSSAKENLLNTSLFNFVTVDTIPAGDERVNVLVTASERWYIWPVPIFEVQERNFNTWWETKNFNRANYGFYLNRENFRGRKEELGLYAQFGYTQKYGLSYTIPYLTHKQTSGAGFSFSYSRNREVAYMTQNNVLSYFKNPDAYVREELSGKLNYTYRKGIHNRHYLEGKFVQGKINDTLKFYTIDYFSNNETEMKFFVIDYSYRSDYRDSKQYPLRGYFWEFEATKLGVGILKDEKVDVTNLYLTLRDYEKLSNRFYLAGGLKIKFSPNKNQPYYVQRGLGWRDYVRGYEYYVIDGQRYVTTKLGLKYEIIKPHVQSIKVPSLNKFSTFHYALYANIFGDAGYADDHQYSLTNPLSNSFIYGYGVGIDYVTYYDVVIRLEYSFNKMMEHGFFVHFDAGI